MRQAAASLVLLWSSTASCYRSKLVSHGEARCRAVLHLAVAKWSANGVVGGDVTTLLDRRARRPHRRPSCSDGASSTPVDAGTASSALHGDIHDYPAPSVADVAPDNSSAAATAAAAAAGAADLFHAPSQAPAHHPTASGEGWQTAGRRRSITVASTAEDAVARG